MQDQMYLGIDEADGSKLLQPKTHLTTHGVIVGMTGSGKTGLGVVLLEELRRQGVPSIIIDPKGDMGNLALTFPDLDGASFEPWVDPSSMAQAGTSREDCASALAERWKGGLQQAKLSAADVTSLKSSTQLRVFTPGSAVAPINILGSLSPPKRSSDANAKPDTEARRDEVESLVSGILQLIGIEADPLESREHILLSNLVERQWSKGEAMDLTSLIQQVHTPPLRKLGVFDMETFFPQKERMKLAMRLNGLIASPAFAAWLSGPALDIEALLYTKNGKPRTSILYISHLSETERQFVVALVSAKLATWMYQQPGTSDLRALLYIDEVFGFVPPSGQPPAKKPLLTLLKQARAFGVGVVLSTQNPVDLDYMAMSNAGTWLIGRLQTERDKLRIVEALASARGGIDVAALSQRIGGLKQRQFLIHDTRWDAPRVFSSRWAMSFLAGPMTKVQLPKLLALVGQPREPQTQAGPSGAANPKPRVGDASANEATQKAGKEGAPTQVTPSVAEGVTEVAPLVAEGVAVLFLRPDAPWAASIGADGGGKTLRAMLAARVNMLFDDAKASLQHQEQWEALFSLDVAFDPSGAQLVDFDQRDFTKEPPKHASYLLPGQSLNKKSLYRSGKTALKSWLHQNQQLNLHRNKQLKLFSRVGETSEEFATRCDLVAQEKADAAATKLHAKVQKKAASLKRKLEASEQRLETAEQRLKSSRTNEVVSGVGSLLSMFLGGRSTVRGMASSARRVSSGRSRSVSARSKVEASQRSIESIEQQLEELEAELLDALDELNEEWQQRARAVEPFNVGLEKTDISVDDLCVLWVPTSAS